MRVICRAVCIASIVLLSLPLFAHLTLQPGWSKAWVKGADASAAATAAGSTIIWYYPQQAEWLVYTPSLARLSQEAAARGAIVRDAQDESRGSQSVSINLRDFINQDAPAEPGDITYAPGTRGLYVLQFAGRMSDEWHARMESLGIVNLSGRTDPMPTVFATPEMIANLDANVWLQAYVILQPRWKFEDGFDPLLYSYGRIDIPEGIPGREAALARYSRLAVAGDANGGCIRNADLLVIARDPIVQSIQRESSLVEIYGTLPAQAPSGAILTITKEGSIGEVLFGALSARIVSQDDSTVRVEVPEGLQSGPVEIQAYGRGGWTQVLPADGARGFRVAKAAGETTFARGDLVIVPHQGNEVLASGVYWFSPEGDRRKRADLEGETLFFGTSGFLHVPARSGNPVRFDAAMDDAGLGADHLKGSDAVVLDADGTTYAVKDGIVFRFTPYGASRGPLPLRAVAIDLDADHCTLAYSNAAETGLYDVCRNEPLGKVIDSGSFRIRFLPDGTLLIARRGELLRVTRRGVLLASNAASIEAMALDPDATLVWLTDGRELRKYDLATNTIGDVLWRPLPHGYLIAGMATYGEWFAARGHAAYADPIVIDRIDGVGAAGTTVTVTGGGWLGNAKVTIGGLAVSGAQITAGAITFTMPAGTLQSHDLVVTNPNGQRGTAAFASSSRRRTSRG